jgi:hypothetical protein
MKNLIRTALIPFVLGLPMLIFGVKELYQVNKFVSRGEKADGIIVEMKKGPSKFSKYLSPVLVFVAFSF